MDYVLLLTCLLRLTKGYRILICSGVLKAQREQLNSCLLVNIRIEKGKIQGSV